MMVSGARKGFWGVPPYERLGGRGVVSVPQMVKGRSLRLIALGVLLCCALALGGCGGGRKGGSLPPAESGNFEGPKGSIADFAAVAAGPAGLCPAGQSGQASCRLRSRPGRTPGSTACSLARGRLYAPPFPPPEAFAIFGGQKKRSKARGWAENLLPWTQENWDQADVERRSGCVPVPVRQGDYRAAHGAARSAHP